MRIRQTRDGVLWIDNERCLVEDIKMPYHPTADAYDIDMATGKGRAWYRRGEEEVDQRPISQADWNAANVVKANAAKIIAARDAREQAGE